MKKNMSKKNHINHLQPTQKHNVVSLQSVQKSSKVVLVEPRVYAEAQDIADQLKNQKSSCREFTAN